MNYAGFTEPSFLLPAADKTQLRVAQGSCRKPHGPGRDAMAILDAVIAKDPKNLNFTNSRPQLLILTGDQIYADDVADSLLYMIMDASETLIGLTEEIPVIGQIKSTNLAAKPGCRTAKLHDKIIFTSGITAKPDTPKSHLLAFGEYMLMYLFVWSDVLWDGNNLPDDFKTITGKIPSKPPGYAGTMEKTEDYKTFMEEGQNLHSFRCDLPAVRRALANIPVYMIFDDHEVTDDWNLNWDWCNTVLNNNGGRRIIANALAAATICQAWGNVPDRYDKNICPESNEVLFLNKVSAVSQGNYASLEQFFVPPLNAIINSQGELQPPPCEIFWNYSITFESFELIALDTRTKRLFPNSNTDEIDFPLVISESSLVNQISAFTKDFVIVAFAPPLVGVPLMENAQFDTGKREERLEYDGEAPGLQPFFFHRFLSRLYAAMCQRNRPHGDILLFSGDVHYGFANRLVYKATRPFRETATFSDQNQVNILQLTASAFRNEVDEWIKAKGLQYSAGAAIRYLFLDIPVWQYVLGFRNEGSLYEKIRDSINPNDYKNTEALIDKIAIDILKPKHHTHLIGSEGIIVDTEELNESAELFGLSTDWNYKAIWYQDLRDQNNRGGAKTNRLLVHANNIGIWEPAGNNGIFSVYWYTNEAEITPPSDPPTQYIIEDLFKTSF